MSPIRTQNRSNSSREARTSTDENTTREHSFSSVTEPIESMLRKIGIENVYGEPVKNGDVTVIPVADLRTGFGYGGGSDEERSTESAGGGGAGLRFTPRGYLEITPERVRYRPIYDLGTVVLGGAVLGWVLSRLLSR